MIQPNALDDLRRLMRMFEEIPHRELHCGHVFWQVIQAAAGNATDVGGLTAAMLPAVGLYGVPVHIDDDMPDAGWRLTENGETVASGDLAPGHRLVVFVPGVGLVAFADELHEASGAQA